MKINDIIKRLTNSDKRPQFLSHIRDINIEFHSKLARLIARLTDSKPFRLFIKYKKPVELFLYIMWLAGCGYWFYHLMITDVTPSDNLGLGVTDSRDALAILFFGTLGSVFVLFFVLFTIKFIYNLFHEGIESLFSVRWHSLVKPASYLVILCWAFSFTGTIKATGLAAYNQIAELFHTSQQHTLVVEKEIPEDLERKLSGLMKMIEKDEQE